MVSNHGSHLDTAVLGSILPMRLRAQTYPLAAGDTFFESPVKAVAATALTNALPVRRKAGDRHALDDLRRRLVEGHCAYLVYPEGTRAAGQRLNPLQAGHRSCLSRDRRCRLSRVTSTARPRPCPRGRRLPRRIPIRVRVGSSITFAQTPNDRAGWQEVADRLFAAVQQLAGDVQPGDTAQ